MTVNDTEQIKKRPSRPALIKSSFVLAIIAFVALNSWLSFSPLPFDEFKFPYKGWAWWTFNDLKAKPDVHNVALLGSSLMVSAISGCDANYLKNSLDLANYHKASYLEHLLRTRFGGEFNTFNLSAPGQMPSDAYLALKAMVNCANRPEVVIYGIAPRDFIDSTLSSPSDTEPFRYLKRLVNIDDVAGRYFRSPYGRLDWWLKRSVYLYGMSLDFQMWVNDQVTQVIAKVVPKPYNNPSFTWWDRVRLLPSYLPGEIHPEAVVAAPIDRKTASGKFADLTEDYVERYRSPDPHTYRTQVFFLKQLMSYCKKERIELIVVNMPITFYNANMLRPGIYGKFVDSMQKAAFEGGVGFYNQCDFTAYPQTDFHDCVHLNAFGGKKFFDKLVESMANDRRSAGALSMAGKELERQQVLTASERNHMY